ncbi:hypothetical protein [Elizabethkingia miricola]|uniref:hypothetical protein n=1 Tax=Elizabethkingia miricola TaxID=172045 RepID=UPI0038922C24
MKGKSVFSKKEAEQIIFLIEQKLKADSKAQKSIRNKIRKMGFYGKDDFGISGGYTVEDFIRVITIEEDTFNDTIANKEISDSKVIKRKNKWVNSDEAYILNMCDDILDLTGLRQYRFDFLRGDTDVKLPVDIYYPTLKLVIEYYEKQHSEEVIFFDTRMTSSGISRREQRKKYDEFRRTEIPKNSLKLIVFDYSEFGHTKMKILLRNNDEDKKIIREKLKNYIPRK